MKMLEEIKIKFRLTLMGDLRSPNPDDGLTPIAETIHDAGLSGTGRVKMKCPCVPMLMSFHSQTFSKRRCILLNRFSLNSKSSVWLYQGPMHIKL